MNILNKPIDSFSFDDVVEFCKQGYGEGYQLDYKRDMPERGLAKHFAAFSNTRGGLILIGVTEDKKNGIPMIWDGVQDDEKLKERIYQAATNVGPLPSFDVHVTEEKNGKVFMLIRIFEGDKTPYYVQNDANLWVRTGNISNPIDIASQDATELLFLKREKAERARTNMVKRANEVYQSALQRGEKEKLALVAEEEDQASREGIPKESRSIYSKTLGTEISLCIIHIQPFYPARAFVTPQELKLLTESIHEKLRWSEDFPPYNMESIPEGLLKFDWGKVSGSIECSQFYAKGLIYHLKNVLQIRPEGKIIWISQIAGLLFMILKTAKNLFCSLGYQGELSGSLQLENVQGMKLRPIVPEGWNFHSEFKIGLLPAYIWTLELNTTLLNNDKELQGYYIEKLKEIYWSLGYSHDSAKEELFKAFLKSQRWLAS